MLYFCSKLQEEGEEDSESLSSHHTQGTCFQQRGAIRKAGYLTVKSMLVQRKKKVERAAKRKWKDYWGKYEDRAHPTGGVIYKAGYLSNKSKLVSKIRKSKDWKKKMEKLSGVSKRLGGEGGANWRYRLLLYSISMGITESVCNYQHLLLCPCPLKCWNNASWIHAFLIPG